MPPGMEFHHIVPHDHEDVDAEVERHEDNPATPNPPIWSEVIIKAIWICPFFYDCSVLTNIMRCMLFCSSRYIVVMLHR